MSKQIRQLEDELGIEIFVRHGKRLVAVTEPGQQVLAIAERMLLDVDNLRPGGGRVQQRGERQLSIATTHTPGPLRAAAGDPGLHDALPQRAPVAASGQSAPGVRIRAVGRGRHRHRHRGYRRGARTGDAALLPVEPLRDRAGAPSHPERPSRSRSRGPSPAIRSSPTTLPSPVATRSTRPSSAGPETNVVLTAIDSGHHQDLRGHGAGIGILGMDYDAAVDKDLGMLDAAHLFGVEHDPHRRAPQRVAARLRYTPSSAVRPLSRHVVDAALAGRRRQPGLWPGRRASTAPAEDDADQAEGGEVRWQVRVFRTSRCRRDENVAKTAAVAVGLATVAQVAAPLPFVVPPKQPNSRRTEMVS